MATPSGKPETASAGRGAARVVLADDDVLLREGLASLLDRSGFDVVGQAGNGVELLAQVRSARPELAIGGADPACGSGLVGLTDRVEALGGSIRLDSTARAGTHITVDLPLEYEPAQSAG